MGDNCPCQFLAWDSEFFGCRIARLSALRLTPQLVQAAFSWCAANRINCLYFLADTSDPTTLSLAQEHSFRPVDVRITLEKGLRKMLRPVASTAIRECLEEDVPRLQAIAGNSHTDSRFYFDGHFSSRRCARLYEIWIEKSYYGYADAVWVADWEGQAAGYLTCHSKPDGRGQIGLFAVAAEAQGEGLGKQLVQAALCWFQEKRLQPVQVVTQGRNTKAQRLYQKAGFLTRSIELWYHRWFDNQSSAT